MGSRCDWRYNHDMFMITNRCGRNLRGFVFAALGLLMTTPIVAQDESVQADTDPATLARQSARAFQAGDHEQALDLADRAVAIDPEHARLRQFRGEMRFRANRIEGSVEDFDEAVRLEPALGPYNWQRGIALYYAKRYADGAAQFESHRSVNGSDVENPVWHFLCVARHESLGAARERVLPVGFDSRVPMTEIYQMFLGNSSPEQVIEKARENEERLTAGQMESRLFYAHLYVGLYLDITGEEREALPHIRKAADEIGPAHYMGDVARVHLADLTKRLEQPENTGVPAAGDEAE